MKKNTRYTSLRSRSFEQLIRVKVHDEIILKKQKQIDLTCFEKNAEQEFSDLYKDIKNLRKVNGDIRDHISEYDSRIKEYKRLFYRHFEDSIFPYSVFCEMWEPDENPERACGYCGITEGKIKHLIKRGSITTKRLYSRGRKMEIDRIEPNGPYSAENIILSCYWCNNAKTDEFSFKEFKDVAEVFKKIWAKRLAE